MSVDMTAQSATPKFATARDYVELMKPRIIKEVLDKSIACDDISAKVVEGPNNLEECDEASN